MAPLLSRFGNNFGLVLGKIGTIKATGGTVTIPGNGFKYHTFTSPETFSVTSGGTVEVLLVGAGGGGGPSYGGGGGAGGLVYGPSVTLSTGTYSITIGTGGGASTVGGDTIFGPGTPTPIIAKGGGGGGNAESSAPGNGGSGCGAGGSGLT